MNIPQSATAQLERIEAADERHNDWFEEAVSIVKDAVDRGGDGGGVTEISYEETA